MWEKGMGMMAHTDSRICYMRNRLDAESIQSIGCYLCRTYLHLLPSRQNAARDEAEINVLVC